MLNTQLKRLLRCHVDVRVGICSTLVSLSVCEERSKTARFVIYATQMIAIAIVLVVAQTVVGS